MYLFIYLVFTFINTNVTTLHIFYAAKPDITNYVKFQGLRDDVMTLMLPAERRQEEDGAEQMNELRADERMNRPADRQRLTLTSRCDTSDRLQAEKKKKMKKKMKQQQSAKLSL